MRLVVVALVTALTAAGCGRGAEEHPPLVVLVDRIELIRAGAADDPLAYLREHGERLDAPRYEGWFHDMAELYFQSEHRLRLGSTAPDVEATIRALAEDSRLWLSVYTHAERRQASQVAAIDPSRDELGRFHTEFVERERLPGWAEDPDELDVAGTAMQAWARAYPRLIERAGPRSAVVIAWDGVASADRVGEMAGG